MSKFKIFLKLTQANLKRLKNYIFPLLISIIILLVICGGAGFLISKNLYKEGTGNIVSIAYYLPDDEDQKSNNFGLNIIKDLEGTKEVVNLIQVETVEEGYDLLEKGDVIYYIIVPEMFFSGIMDSTNPELTILFRDNSDITAYISNELFGSYARYLGVAQAGVYSALDTLRIHDTDSDERHQIQKMVNIAYLDRSLNKDNYFEKKEATGEGNHSLLEHYMAVALMLSLFFVSFTLMPYLQGYNKGMITKLVTCNINTLHIFITNTIATIPALYVAFIPCFIIISIITETFNLIGLIWIIPSIILISLIINIISSLCKNQFTSNMVVLTFTLIVAYVSGGILPQAMLPDGVKDLSAFLPGEFIINNIANSLFGL